MTENTLANETSPYLLQHKDNPVAWQPWSEETLELAARENKPILLSVGYAACHWCHVMAHESFEDDEIAALMNELFVNIKVDREERPDLDTIYQTALALLGEHGGWPLTMFLTPKGEPFWGGTYFPREPRYGRPGFAQVLHAVADAYRQQPEKVQQNVDALSEALGRQARASERGTVSLDQFDPLARQLIRVVDPVLGGLAQPPKFPHTPVFEFLWRNYLRTGAEDMRDAVVVTSTRMSEGGIYDHLGGGFARYATDAEWLVPHFEKMLYDNAQLIDLLTMVWQETRNPLFARRIAETVDWVLREMTTEEGAFASSIDADSEGEEGKFYVWTEAEIDALLGENSPFFKQVYDVRPGGNWEGNTILNRSKAPPLSEEDESRLEPLRQTLWEAREQRVRPGWDDKVLADWNGLMIAALADAGAVFGQPGWIAAAESAFAFVATTMSADDRLLHAYRAGQVRHPAMLDDYALMARAALHLHEVTGDSALLARAEAWADVVEQHFRDPAEGGYFMTADDAERLIVRTKSVQDAALPAGNAVMIEVFARLYHLTGKAIYRERADAQIEAFAGQLNRNAFGLMTFLNNVELFLDGRQIVIVGHRDDPRVRAFMATVRDLSLPHRTIKVLPPGADLPPGHPASGKGQIEGAPTVYLCVGTTCSLPVTEPAQLRDMLLQSRASSP